MKPGVFIVMASGLVAAVASGAVLSSSVLPFVTGMIAGGGGVLAVRTVWSDWSSLRRLPLSILLVVSYGIVVALASELGGRI